MKFIFMMRWAEQAELKNEILEGENRIHGMLDMAHQDPVIVELSQEHPIAVMEEHCKRFIEIFAASKTGKLSKKEFADFVKFIFMMQWAEHCKRFIEIFDASKTGKLSKKTK